MRFTSKILAPLAVLTLATTASAQDPEPGSVLVYPSTRGTDFLATLVSVTNTSLAFPTAVRFRYVNVVPGPAGADPFVPDDCFVEERIEFLTPGDTFSVPVFCHNVPGFDGYLVIDAIDPAGQSVSFNRLVGSEYVISGASTFWTLGATSFQSPLPMGMPTDLDGDGELDFDSIEYTTCPGEYYLDSFIGSIGTNLALINLTGGTPFIAEVSYTVFNDNEQPVSINRKFRCWFDEPLDSIGAPFTQLFLTSTIHDPGELDIDCDGAGDIETGWAIIRGVVAESPDQSIPAPALLGALTTSLSLDRGRPLFRVQDNRNGDFLGFSTVHPEFP